MFGYVLPDEKTITKRDYVMFQSAYCGLCMSTKKSCGNIARLTTNYDSTVLGLLLLEATKPDVEFDTVRCIGDFRRKPCVKDFGLWRTLADLNVLLCHYKMCDDVADGGSKHRIMRHVLKKPYRRAKERLADEDRIISDGYARLRAMEAERVASVDRVADCFAVLLRDLAVSAAKHNSDKKEAYYNAENPDELSREGFGEACYNIGKFVYIADALDDVEEDVKAKRYNPFVAVWNDFGKGGRAAYIAAHEKELTFMFASVRNRAVAGLNKMRLTHAGDLLRNIIDNGLSRKTEMLFGSKKKLSSPTFRYNGRKEDGKQGGQ